MMSPSNQISHLLAVTDMLKGVRYEETPLRVTSPSVLTFFYYLHTQLIFIHYFWPIFFPRLSHSSLDDSTHLVIDLLFILESGVPHHIGRSLGEFQTKIFLF